MEAHEQALVQRIEADVSTLPAVAEDLVVNSAETYQRAGEFVRLCDERVATVERELDPLRAGAHAAWKRIVAKIAELCAPAKQARAIAGDKMAAWDRETERLRAAAAAAAEVDRRRLEREAREKTAAAEAAERAGRPAEAAVERRAAVAAAVGAGASRATPEAAPKISGLSMRRTWSAEVVDFRALVEHVAREPLLLGLLAPNMEALNAEARGAKAVDLGIPGVRGVERRAPARTGR